MALAQPTGNALYRGSFERMRQRIWECLRNPDITDFSVRGWEGVGRTFFTKQVIEEFQNQQESVDETIKLFDLVVWLENVHSNMDAVNGVNEQTRMHRHRMKRLLVVINCNKQEFNDCSRWHISRFFVDFSFKFVILTASRDPIGNFKIDQDIHEEWGTLSEDEAWALLCHVAENMASDLNIQIYLTNGRDTAMHCLSYCFLYTDNSARPSLLVLRWKAEGFLHGVDSWEQMFAARASLMEGLWTQAIVEREEDYYQNIRITRSIRSKVVPILERGGRYFTSFYNDSSLKAATQFQRRFLVRCQSELGEAPKVDEWENIDLERISLIGNKIKTLADVGPPPKCPHLSTLLLSDNPCLDEIPEHFFQHMQGLRVLSLSFTGIVSLPSSLFSLTNLRYLGLAGCQRLETLSFPLFHALEKLEMLNLEGTALPKLTQASFQFMPNLWLLNICDASNLTQLDLRGCCSLNSMFLPDNLETLDLSSTKIQSFLPSNFSSLTQLKRLDLLNTKHLIDFPWDKMNQLPETLNWKIYRYEPPLQEQVQSNQGYCITVSDHQVFKNLYRGSILWEKYLKKFRFSVISCDQPQTPTDASNHFGRTNFIYKGIYVSMAKQHQTKVLRNYDRCLKIDGINDVPYGIRGVLYHTELFTLCNNSVTHLSILGVENMENLRECRIKNCPNMQWLITTRSTTNVPVAMIRLENLQVIRLTHLKSVCKGTIGEGSFSCLRCIYLEDCPRLFSLFSSRVCLESLEALQIRFCYKLEKVFEEEDVIGQEVFPQLKELYLFRLPKLRSICSGKLPALKQLKIHGCELLQQQHLLVKSEGKAKDS